MLEKLLHLSITRLIIIAAVWVVCVAAHNLVFALSLRWLQKPIEEPVFFLLAVVVLPAYVIAAAIYTTYARLRHWFKRSSGE